LSAIFLFLAIFFCKAADKTIASLFCTTDGILNGEAGRLCESMEIFSTLRFGVLVPVPAVPVVPSFLGY